MDLADAVKDTVAEDVLPAISMHMEVQDAVLGNADEASMAAGPPTMRIPHPMTSNVKMPRRGKHKRVVLNPNIDESASEPEKALPNRNRWNDWLPGSSSEWEPEGEVNTTNARDRTVPRLNPLNPEALSLPLLILS